MSHTESDLNKLVHLIKSLSGETKVVMEYTGAYYEPIANALHNQGIFLSVVNPLLIDDYSACLIPAFQMLTHYSLHFAESLTDTKNGSISC